MPRISIVMPAYNAEDTIQEAIASIQNQTFDDWELLVVDDGSQDDTALRVAEIASSDDRIILMQREHEGVSHARQAGMDEAQGEYLIFCDADDFLPKHALEIMIAFIGNADICVGDMARVWNAIIFKPKSTSPCFQIENPTIYDRTTFIQKLYCSWFGISNVPVNLCGKLFRTELLKKAYQLTPPVVRFYGEDLTITLNAMPLAEKICFIPNCVYCYRVGGGTAKYNPYMMEDWLALYRYKNSFSKRYPMPQNIQILMDVELCNMTIVYLQMLADSGKFSLDELRGKIVETLQISEVSAALSNPDIPHGKFANVELCRYHDSEKILEQIILTRKQNQVKKWIKNLVYKFA